MARKKTPDSDPQTLIVTPAAQQNCIVMQRGKLLVINGPLQGQEFMIDKDVLTLGSDPHNDIFLQDTTVSRRHCEIQTSPSGYVIRDLGSTNGTIVHGVRIGEAILGQGAEFQLGKTKIIFCPLQQTRRFSISSNTSFGKLLGKSTAMRRVFHLAETYSPTDATILIEGETGTGKEVLAEEIHNHSKRSKSPFVVIDCASLAKDLVASELFGHVKGAFTGANTERIGAFEQAQGGTVFLDEIGDLSPSLQPQLLRVLEKREVKRVGSNQIRPINVRIISATNRSIQNEVNAGRFREDLYYRLSVAHIEIPPLRVRKEDIPDLTMKFLTDFHGEEASKQIVHFDRAMEAFRQHDWPGNVRELRNIVEIASCSGHQPIDLGSYLYFGRMKGLESSGRKSFAPNQPFKIAKNGVIQDFETDYIREILSRHNGNITKAARDAGIERAYLQRLIKKYGLNT